VRFGYDSSSRSVRRERIPQANRPRAHGTGPRALSPPCRESTQVIGLTVGRRAVAPAVIELKVLSGLSLFCTDSKKGFHQFSLKDGRFLVNYKSDTDEGGMGVY
jgi:hypothetical protein